MCQRKSGGSCKEWIQHVEYEWEMLKYSFAKLHQRTRELEKYEMTRNAYLECFLLHFRNLYEFLFEPKKREDDLRASSLVPNWEELLENSRTMQNLKEQLHEDYKKCHKYLAHLTKERLSPQGWEITRLFKEISTAYKYFNKWWSKAS